MAVATIGTMKASSADDLQAGGSGNELAFSIVIPIYNEAACLPRLCQELADVLSGLAQRWEVVLVDDASLDRTAAHLADISACCPRIRHYRLSKHRGQSEAIAAGIREARAPVIVTMDGDLQNDPRDIPSLLAYLNDYDAVCGWRNNRRDGWWRRLQSFLGRIACQLILGTSVRNTGCSLKAFRRDVLSRLPQCDNFHRWLPVMFRLGGVRTIEVPVTDRPRAAGCSKYGFVNRGASVVRDLLKLRAAAARPLCPQGSATLFSNSRHATALDQLSG